MTIKLITIFCRVTLFWLVFLLINSCAHIGDGSEPTRYYRKNTSHEATYRDLGDCGAIQTFGKNFVTPNKRHALYKCMEDKGYSVELVQKPYWFKNGVIPDEEGVDIIDCGGFKFLASGRSLGGEELSKLDECMRIKGYNVGLKSGQ